ncbi:sensor histidine kinase [Cellulophaga sp. Z1A5H]|uniref:sensor histidine kinase n=1 Tax=Cellulophaga sp. Z1A5H TaxID=2687291 RepID=UPI0013FD20FC|nr:ATP-binding protein [Cellulophaga sp. Z1A5H]
MNNKFFLHFIFILFLTCYQSVFAIDFIRFKKKNSSLPLTENTSDSLKIIKKQIGAFTKKKEYAYAIQYSKKLLQAAKIKSDTSTIDNAYWRQAFYFDKLNQLDSSYFYYDKSYTYNLALKDTVVAGERLLGMANIQKSLGDYTGALITAIDGLKYLENSSALEATIGLYQIITVSQKELGNQEEALRWNKKAFDILKKNPKAEISPSSIHIINITKANILAEKKEYRASVHILDSIAQETAGKNLFEFSRAICNMGHFKWLEDANNPKSETLLLESLRIRTSLNTSSGLFSSYIHLAEFYFNTKKPKALGYAQQAFLQSEKLNNPVATLEALDLILPLKKELHLDLSNEAITYSRIQSQLEKSRQAVRAIYAATRYDHDALERKNLTLLAQVATKEKQGILALSAVVFLLGVIGFVIYYKNQQKQKEQLEMAYKTELRLSKKLHDELGNDIFYLMTQVQKEATDASASKKVLILDGLDSIYQRIRDISKEFTAIDTGKNFGKEFFALLNSYSSANTKLITKELNDGFWDEVAPKTKIELYRVLQELLVNMKKHSKASFVAITCVKNDKEVMIKYVDNGIGFNKKESFSGNGIKNVENRMDAIKGTINFDSKPNEGVTATLTFTI